jgi:hypothetical protein
VDEHINALEAKDPGKPVKSYWVVKLNHAGHSMRSVVDFYQLAK